MVFFRCCLEELVILVVGYLLWIILWCKGKRNRPSSFEVQLISLDHCSRHLWYTNINLNPI